MLCIKGVHRFVRHFGGESSNGRVILASLIAAGSLCPNEQILNRLTEGGGEKDISSRYLLFLVAFITRPLSMCAPSGSGGNNDTK
jgi:hypothetical protein